MSSRPILKKKAARVRKALRKELPAYVDLFRWLKDRGHAQTSGDCRKLLLDGRVKSESHTVGIVTVQTEKGEIKVIERLQPVSMRPTLRVVSE
jgi:hypothetical protein